MLVELKDVAKRYQTSSSEITAVSNVDLTLQKGEFVAVCGPSGCGKSTLLLMTGGLLRPDAGSVTIDGKSVYAMSASKRAQYRAETIGFVFQQFHLVPYLSVIDNVLAARLGMGKGDRKTAFVRAMKLIEQFGLEERKRHRPSQLSTGERQRTALARALLNQPKVLLADEPTGNLDRSNADVVLDQLRAFTDEGGTVMLVTHDVHSAERADRIVRIEQGAVAHTS